MENRLPISNEQQYMNVIVNLQQEVFALIKKNVQLTYETQRMIIENATLYARNQELVDKLAISKWQSEFWKSTLESERKDHEIYKMRLQLQSYQLRIGPHRSQQAAIPVPEDLTLSSD